MLIKYDKEKSLKVAVIQKFMLLHPHRSLVNWKSSKVIATLKEHKKWMDDILSTVASWTASISLCILTKMPSWVQKSYPQIF